MARRASIPVDPEELRADAILTADFADDASPFNDVPVNAKCVTFTMILTPNAAQAAPNIAESILEWRAEDPLTGAETVVSRGVLGDGANFVVAGNEGTLPFVNGVWRGPSATTPTVQTWDWTFPIPAGKASCRVRSREATTGDRVNPGNLRVLIAYQGSNVGT